MPRQSSKTAKPTNLRGRKAKGGRPPAADVERRAAHLREVALEVFVEFGYERASLSEIVKRAGASKGTLYSRYAGKADLFVAVIQDYLESHLQPFSDLLEERGSLEHNLRNFAFRLLTLMQQDGSRNLTLVVFAEAGRFPDLGRRFWAVSHQRGEDEMALYMQQQITQGLLRQGDPDLMAQEFLYLLTGRMLLRSILNVDRSLTATQRRSLANTAVDTFLRAYGA